MVGVEAFHKIGYVVIGFVKLNLRHEDVVDPIDLAFIEVGIVCTGAAAVVNYAQSLAQVVKEIGARAHQAVHLSLPQEVSYELAEARRHHRTCQTEEDCDILIHHSFPDAQGCTKLASLEAHANPALARHVTERGQRLKAALRTLRSPLIKDVRGVGLLVAIDFALDGAALNDLVKRALRDGLILLQSGPAGDVLAFTPPFAISDEEIDFSIGRLSGYLEG